jgi:hypothetical protein
VYERQPFEIPLFISTEDMCFVLNKTPKGVKAQSTREGWGYRVRAEDTKIFWVVTDTPFGVRHDVLYKLLKRDADKLPFHKMIEEEFMESYQKLSFEWQVEDCDRLLNSAALCRRLEMVDDIMTYIPNAMFEYAVLIVAQTTETNPYALQDFCKPDGENLNPIFAVPRRYWITSLIENAKAARNIVEQETRSKEARALNIKVKRLQPATAVLQ